MSLFSRPRMVPESVVLDLRALSDASGDDDAAFAKAVTLAVQGVPVEMNEDEMDMLGEAMIAFDVIQRVSPMAVLRTRAGMRVMLFCDEPDRYLQEASVRTEFADATDLSSRLFGAREAVRELMLAELWEPFAYADELSRLHAEMRAFAEKFMPCDRLVFEGVSPWALPLLMQRAVYGRVKEVWHHPSGQTPYSSVYTQPEALSYGI